MTRVGPGHPLSVPPTEQFHWGSAPQQNGNKHAQLSRRTIGSYLRSVNVFLTWAEAESEAVEGRAKLPLSSPGGMIVCPQPLAAEAGRDVLWAEGASDGGKSSQSAAGPARLPSMEGTFTGWKGDFQGFFVGLRANNSKAYFESHRRHYEEEVKGPMLALLADLEPEFGVARLSRPNRDIRFTADKSPYKTNIYADLRGGGYVALDASGLVAAGGRYMIDAPQLARFRDAIAAERSGRELAGIVDRLREKGYELGGQELKRVPPPHPQDHPRRDLLRHKRLIYWRRWLIGPWIATPDVRERVALVWRDGAELNAWLTRHLDG